MVRESIVTIGKPTPLVGVLTEPRGVGCEGSPRTGSVREGNGDIALLLMNSGIMHRVGACRLSVRLARAVADEVGVPCVRFDFSGIGDSEARRGSLDFDQTAVNEVLEVMDYLRDTRRINRFILYGLCSAAAIACNAAEQDERVTAVAQVDGYCYPTAKSHVSYCMYRLFSRERWRTRLANWAGDDSYRGSVLVGGKADFEVPEFARDPGRQAIAGQLRMLMARRMRLLCVFTGIAPHYGYHSQYRDCFYDVDFGESLRVYYYPRASHIFTEPVYQRQLISDLVTWIARQAEDRSAAGYGPAVAE